jgi:hypothetical protein
MTDQERSIENAQTFNIESHYERGFGFYVSAVENCQNNLLLALVCRTELCSDALLLSILTNHAQLS